MIFIFLIVLIVALILANLFIRIAKPKKTPHYFKEPKEVAIEPEVITHVESIHEKNALIEGNLSATNNKLNLINERVSNLERGLSELVETKLENSNKTMDMEKIDFRISVLEQQLDEIQNPKPKQKTFYGKVNDGMEKEIQSLVFNSKRKN